MTAYARTAAMLPHASGNEFMVSVVVPTAMDDDPSADTLEVTLPDGCPKDALPLGLMVYELATNTYTANTGLLITSHDRSTGKTLLTVDTSGVIAAGAKLLLEYVSM